MTIIIVNFFSSLYYPIFPHLGLISATEDLDIVSWSKFHVSKRKLAIASKLVKYSKTLDSVQS